MKKLKDLFVPLSECIKLKEMGCNYHTLGWYSQGKLHIQEYNNSYEYSFYELHDEFPAYLYQQIFEWFRDEYGIDVEITRCFSMTNSYYYYILVKNDRDNVIEQEIAPNRSFLQSQQDCLEKVIKIHESSKH